MTHRDLSTGIEQLNVIRDQGSVNYFTRKMGDLSNSRSEYFDYCYGSHFPEAEREAYWQVRKNGKKFLQNFSSFPENDYIIPI